MAKIFFLCLLGGIFYGLGFPHKNLSSFGFGPVIGMTLFFSQLSFFNSKQSWKQDVFAWFNFSASAYFIIYNWIPFTLQEFGNIHFPWNHIFGLFFIIFVFPQYLLCILFFYVINKKFSFLIRLSFISRNILFSTILTLLDYFIPQIFPNHTGYMAIHLSPYLKLATIFGFSFFSFLTFWFALSFITWIKSKKIDILAIFLFFPFIFVSIFFPLKYPTSSKESLNLRLVQANIENIKKKSNTLSMQLETLQIYQNLTLHVSEKPLDIIIWPESSFPYLLNSKKLKENPSHIPQFLNKIYQYTHADLFFGGMDQVQGKEFSDFENIYNAAFFLTSGKIQEVYHKTKLIPFGETFPFGHWNYYLKKYVRTSFFKQGESFPIFTTKKDVNFIASICYEILFPEIIRKYLTHHDSQTPHFIINITNDSWFGNTDEPFQHLFIARFRAIEFQIPIVRVTNTGITSVLYPNGTESRQIEINQQNILDIELPIEKVFPTFYQKWGILSLIVFMLALLLLSFFFLKIRRGYEN